MRDEMKTGRWTLPRVGGALSLLLLFFAAVDVEAQIQNPGFTNGLDPWTILTGQNYSVAWDGNAGNAASGSASFTLTSSTGSTESFFLKQCFPATGSTTYDVGGSFLYPSSVATTPSSSIIFQSYSDATCTTSLPGLSGFGVSNFSSPADTWITTNYPGGFTTPAGTVAVRVLLDVRTLAAGTTQGFFDDIRFVSVKADLGVTKTSTRATAVPGQPITYTITASNAGPSAVIGATVMDTLPAVITNATWTCAATGSGVCTASGSSNINDMVNLSAGDSVIYTLTGTVSAIATGTLSNTATVTVPSGVTDPNTPNNSATDTLAIVPVTTHSDFNGDHKSDVSLQNSSNGAVAVWLIDGTTITSGAVVNTPAVSWKIVATGDFDGDGKADLLLQNSTTGDVAEWRMNGAMVVAGTVIATPGTSWKVIATGDFNGDGKSDIVLQNSATGDVAEWQMNGMTIAAGGIVGSPGTAYKLVAAGDFNGDGRSDIVLQNAATGDVAEWQLNGMAVTAGGIVGSPGTAYKVVATGDFDNDGKSDVLLQNSTTGDVALWKLNGMTITGAAVFGGSGTAWKVVGTGDFTADGTADIVLQNSTTGDVAEWQLNSTGTAVTTGAILGGSGTSWVAMMN